jgi:hypothetical protein
VIRKATRADIPRIVEIRAAVRENKLRDPSRVTIEDICWFIDNPGIFVWVKDSRIVGFSAADPRDGSIYALWMRLMRGVALPALYSSVPARSS